MKRLTFILGLLLCSLHCVFSQTSVKMVSENFDNPDSITLTGTPTSQWKLNSRYFQTPLNSYRGIVPNVMGDSIVLNIPDCDFTGMDYVILRFKHICKISPNDNLRIEYKVGLQKWTSIFSGPNGISAEYKGTAINPKGGFSAASYSEWRSNDSLVIPDNDTWWKEEVFDLSSIVSSESSVQIRFVLKRGATQGTQIAYGWLLDDFEIITAPHMLSDPIVEFVSPFVRDTVNNVGPWTIHAKVETTTYASIEIPYLKWTTDGGTTYNSVLMTLTAPGSSIWHATIPQYVSGTTVSYSITGRDVTLNEKTIHSEYIIQDPSFEVLKEYIYHSPEDTTSGTQYNGLFYATNATTSWSRALFKAEYLKADQGNVLISRAAWYNRNYNIVHTKPNLLIYMKAVSDNLINMGYVDPVTDGATLVYKGSHTSSLSWNEIILDNSFLLPQGSNLMIYVVDSSGAGTTAGGIIYWARGTTIGDTNAVFSELTTVRSELPIMRFGLSEVRHDNHSVSLISIDNPIRETIMSGDTNSIVVTVQNRGFADLDSVTISWQVNGEAIIDKLITFSPALPWDFKEQVYLGNFTPIPDVMNNLKVWASIPNGQLDPITRDDTLTVELLGCPPRISGRKIIGGAGADFDSIRQVYDLIINCGIGGDLELALGSGTYTTNIDLTDMSNFIGNYSLTITSAEEKADSVIIRPAAGAAIVLNNSNNLTIRNITVDVSAYANTTTAASPAIRFDGACTNVVIRDCKLLSSTSNTTSGSSNSNSVILKNSSTGIADNISFINNDIRGGYVGWYFYGGSSTTAYAANIVFDSNTVTSQYSTAVYPQYLNLTGCNRNTIESKSGTTGIMATWYGIRTNYVNGPVVGNRIIQRTSSVTQPYGISLTYHNTTNNSAGTRALIANNELILSTTGAYYGIQTASGAKTSILHNSIYMAGAGAGRGIHIANTASNDMEIKNNNIVMVSSTAHPIYFSATGNLPLYDMDYNNLYAPAFIGYYGAAIQDMSEWRKLTQSDAHTTNADPGFTNLNNDSLQISNYVDLLCEYVPPVNTDISGKPRVAFTTKGCYDGLPSVSTNVMLTKILDFRTGVVAGQSDSLKVVILNTGTTPINLVNLEWTINDLPQQLGGLTFATSSTLAKGESDTITFGEINYIYGAMDIKVWLNSINGGSADDIATDDTIGISGFICNIALIDTIHISPKGNGDFLSIEDAFAMGEICGVGNVVLMLDTGIYNQNINLKDISDLFGNYSLTITSVTGNADDVIIRPASGAAIILNNSNNLIIKDITVDVRTLTIPAIQFTGACINVLIRDCKLLGNTTSTSSGTSNNHSVIYKYSSTGVVDNISFIHNVIDGGYAGLYFYGGTGTGAGAYGTNIVFDSNTVSNQHERGVYTYYVDFISCAYNTITNKPSGGNSTWYGLYLYYTNGPISGNRIIQPGATSTVRGIYGYHYGDWGNSRGLIANNEIILNATGSTYYGIDAYYTTTDIIHNSIYLLGTGAGKGVYGNTSANIAIYNNNIIATPSSSYPVYRNSGTMSANNNNYYAPTYLGYYEGNINQGDWATWRDKVPGDSSVSILPNFKNLEGNSLELQDYMSLYCDLNPRVTADIMDYPRRAPTTMGCYEEILFPVNAAIAEIIGLREGLVDGETDTIKAVITNLGTTSLNSVKLELSIDGTIQSPADFFFSSPLGRLKSDTLIVGTIPYTSGYRNVKVYINNLNQGLLQDGDLSNDTLLASVYVCGQPYSGNISISDTGRFPSITEAFRVAAICGVDDDATFLLDSGTYTGSLTLNTVGIFEDYLLTITSVTGKAEDVVFRSNGGVPIILNGTNNVTLKAITVDVRTQEIPAIQFTGNCNNVVIRDCRLLGNPTTTSTSTGGAVINKGGQSSVSGWIENVSFINNLINGGSYSMYFYGGSSSEGYSPMIFDSNTVINACSTGVSLTYVDLISCSYNTISSRVRPDSTSNAWTAIYLANANGNIIGNHIIQRHTPNATATAPVGIRVGSFNTSFNEGKRGLISNNEISLEASNANARGINLAANSNVDVIHNTIYMRGATAAMRGINMDAATVNAVIYNNNIVMTSTGAYPIYFTSGGTLVANYNNYRSPTNIGYHTAAVTNANMATWQSRVPTDLNSVMIPQIFVANDTLKSTDYTGLACVPYSTISEDIDGNDRGTIFTTMGCYEGNLVPSRNASLQEFLGISQPLIYGNNDNIQVVFANTGSQPIDSVNIEWKVEDVSYGSKTEVFTPPLAAGGSATILLGNHTYVIGNINIKAWINQTNDWTSGDDFKADDTLRFSSIVCKDALAGIIPVSDTSEYTSINKALEALSICNAKANVTFLLDSGTYIENVNLTNVSNYLNGYLLTITSATGKAEDVVIRPTIGAAIVLNNSNDLIIKAITADVKTLTNTPAIQFFGACTNVLIRDCRLMANSTSTTSNTANTPVSKANKTGIVDKISFINNSMDGGYYGWYFFGGTKEINGTNIVFDSNTLSNQSCYAIHANRLDFISCNNNTLLSRTEITNYATTWNGIYISYTNGPVTGNHIIQRTTEITNHCGIYSYYHNYNQGPSRGLIANNEMILYTTSLNNYSMYASYANVDIINNSVYTTGSGQVRGIYLYTNANTRIYNNNIVMTSFNAYPIYYGATNLNTSLNYNNYYAESGYIGYYGNNGISTLADWQQLFPMDTNSVTLLPDFIDPTANLMQEDYSGFECAALPSVPTDILNNTRDAITAIGCYNPTIVVGNSRLVEIVINGKQEIGLTDTIKVVLKNTGITPISSINLEWSIDNVSQNSGGSIFTLPNSLAQGQTDTVTLGYMTHTADGVYAITVWINEVNGGSLFDEFSRDDTVRTSIQICSNPLSGRYVVDAAGGGDFLTLAAAFSTLNCAGGDITFALVPGTYNYNFDLSNNAAYMRNYTLTIESTINNADSVIIRPSSGAGITLSNTRNLIIRNITVDVRTLVDVAAIQFTAACANITVRDCKLLVNPSSSILNKTTPVLKEKGTGRADNISFINNLMDGGYYGWYFYGGTEAVYGTNVIFDSNTVSNQYYYGIYSYYTDFTSCSYNTVLTRMTGSFTYWWPVYIYNSNGPIIGNRIIQRDPLIQSPTGIECRNYNTTNRRARSGLIANNEMILNSMDNSSGNNYGRGIYLSNGYADIIHNSIYITGPGAAKGVYINQSTNENTNAAIYNNIITMTSPTAHPIYRSAGTMVANYNNYYAPINIGYYGGDITSMVIWQQRVPSDQNSVKVLPNFVNVDNSLELSNYTGLLCPLLSSVPENILGENRTTSTTMGAYSVGIEQATDMEISSILLGSENLSSLCLTDYASVKIKVFNKGIEVFDFSSDALTFNVNVTSTSAEFIPFDTIITINTGRLEILETKELQIIDSLDVFHSGTYNVTVTISHPKDTIANNDTVHTVYYNTRIPLPMDEDFSAGIPVEKFEFTEQNTMHVWTPVSKGLGRDTALVSDFGSQMIAFGGSRGAMVTLSTKQIALSRTRLPELDLWYYHDTIESEDYTDIRITVDGTITYEPLLSLIKQSDTVGWKHYSVPLSLYTDGSCISLLFESMTKSENMDDGYQYIDRIRIISQPDLELSNLTLSGLSVCDLETNELKIKRTTTTNQIIDFSKYSTDIQLEITGPINYSRTYQLTDILEGDTFDIITIASNIPFVPGTYTMTAYLTSPVDEYNVNDTVRTTIIINPAISVEVNQMSGGSSNCLEGESAMFQTIDIINTGNMDIANIGLILQIDTGEAGDPLYLYHKETYTGVITAGSTIPYTFINSYIVPWIAEYQVTVLAYLLCDSLTVNAADAARECTDMVDLYLVSVDRPLPSAVDKAGEAINVEVTLRNRYDASDFNSVQINVLVENSQGEQKASFYETCPKVAFLSTVHYEFNNTYTVPNDTVYYLTVYLDSYDNYKKNDTIRMRRVTDYVNNIESIGGNVSISMDQNIPNPANNNTMIRYNIPESGDVTFRIHSINGQLLYNKTVQSEGGINTIEINTSILAAGIYMYSMDYKGQRVVKRMSIKR